MKENIKKVEDIKSRLEQMEFAKQSVRALGAGGYKKEIDSKFVAFCLDVDHGISVKEQNISFDFDKMLCYIKLTDKETAIIPITNDTGIKSLTPRKRKK